LVRIGRPNSPFYLRIGAASTSVLVASRFQGTRSKLNSHAMADYGKIDLRQKSLVRSGGRVVECTGLENRRAERYRGFESLPDRLLIGIVSLVVFPEKS